MVTALTDINFAASSTVARLAVTLADAISESDTLSTIFTAIYLTDICGNLTVISLFVVWTVARVAIFLVLARASVLTLMIHAVIRIILAQVSAVLVAGTVALEAVVLGDTGAVHTGTALAKVYSGRAVGARPAIVALADLEAVSDVARAVFSAATVVLTQNVHTEITVRQCSFTSPVRHSVACTGSTGLLSRLRLIVVDRTVTARLQTGRRIFTSRTKV